MKKALVFSHVWAIWWWRNTHVNATAQSLREGVTAIGGAPSTEHELNESGAESERALQLTRGVPASLPLELLSKDSVPHTRLLHVKVHQWNGRILPGSICRAGQHYVIAPEFCFVLMACDIKRICEVSLRSWQYVVILAELGCELCGTYSKLNTARGFKGRKQQLTNVMSMRAFAADLVHERGSALAYDALRWVIDMLNSPMETVVYLMMCLPRAWGGRALPKPRSNVILPVPEHLWNKTDKRRVVPDLCWMEWGLIVEFFGAEFHEGHERNDMDRLEIEQDMGYKVITFWKEDVLDLDKFNAKVDSIARYLGITRKAEGEEFKKLQSTLRSMLVRHQRWI